MRASEIFIYPGFISLNLLFAKAGSTVLAWPEIVCLSSLSHSYGMIFEMHIFFIFLEYQGEIISSGRRILLNIWEQNVKSLTNGILLTCNCNLLSERIWGIANKRIFLNSSSIRYVISCMQLTVIDYSDCHFDLEKQRRQKPGSNL